MCIGHAFSLFTLAIFFFALFYHLLTVLNPLFLFLSFACISPDEKALTYTCETKNFQDVRKQPEVCPFYEYYRIFVSEETIN